MGYLGPIILVTAVPSASLVIKIYLGRIISKEKSI